MSGAANADQPEINEKRARKKKILMCSNYTLMLNAVRGCEQILARYDESLEEWIA